MKHKAQIVEFTVRVFIPVTLNLVEAKERLEVDVLENFYDYGALAHEVLDAKVTSAIYELPDQPDAGNDTELCVRVAEAHEALWQYIFSHPFLPPTEDWCCHGECQNIAKAYIVDGFAICSACGWVDVVERPADDGPTGQD